MYLTFLGLWSNVWKSFTFLESTISSAASESRPGFNEITFVFALIFVILTTYHMSMYF